MITPHGGKLINKILSPEEKKEILAKANEFRALILDKEQVKDVKNIGNGVYSPLEGFLRKDDFQKVVSEMRLSNGTVWSIPIVLDVSEKDLENIKNEKEILLNDLNKNPVALLKDIEVFDYNKDSFARNVFGTLDKNHPGVEGVYKMGKYLVGGEIKLLDDSREPFPEYNFTPQQTREIFEKRGWNTVVAFQTRNIPHRGHEFLQKEALREVDGLFVQPVIGEKKTGDFKDEYILISYEILIQRYYPKNRVFLGILPLKMRYAGPREAVLHAILRRNFGCTHFIVGRDHAGVGNYYGPFDAQNIFNNFKKDEIGVTILKYPEVVYNPIKKTHLFANVCPPEERVSFSGTKLRKSIQEKQIPPDYIIRPVVYNFLSQSSNSLVDDMYKKTLNQKGFVLWFTGLSQSGKSTVADKVYNILKERGLKLERLDGDIVRQSISSDLGFSKEDRDENIKRVTFVSKLLSKNGIGVISSFISPYREERRKAREEVNNFIEVFCNAPLEVCEARDGKGLYKKARNGEIKNFTGISDPYEPPDNPEIELKTDIESVDESVNKVIRYLEEHNFV